MEIAKRYFKYRLKSIARPLLLIIASVVVIGAIYFSQVQDSISYFYNEKAGREVIVNEEYPNGYYINGSYYFNGSYYNFGGEKMVVCSTPSVLRWRVDRVLGFSQTVLIIMCMVAPVWSFSFFKNRRNLDCCYSLPISRRALGIVHWLIGLLTVLLPFLASSLQALIILIFKTPSGYSFLDTIDVGYIFAYFAVAFIGMLVLYSLYVFVFNEANSVSDGITFMILYNFVATVAAILIEYIVGSSIFSIFDENSLPISAMSSMIEYIVMYAGKATDVYYDINVGWIIFWIIAGFACATYFVFSFGTRKTEKAEEISDSYFGYRTLIPFFGFSLIFVFDNIAFISLVFTIISVLLYTVYRRGVKYKVSDIAVMGIMLFLTLIAFATS